MPDFQLLHAALNPRTPWPPSTGLHSNAVGGMPRKPPSKPPKPSNVANADTDLLDLGAFNAPLVPIAPADVFTSAPNPFLEVTSPLASVDQTNMASNNDRPKEFDPFSEFLAKDEKPRSVDPFSTVLNALQSSSASHPASRTDDDPFAGL